MTQALWGQLPSPEHGVGDTGRGAEWGGPGPGNVQAWLIEPLALLCPARLVSAGPETPHVLKWPSGQTRPSVLQRGRDPEAQPQPEPLADPAP